MKLLPLLVFFFWTSCKEDNAQQKQFQADTIIYTEKSLKPDKSIQLKFYKCDYNTKKYYTILSSGHEHETDEIWGINKKDIAKLPVLDKASLDTNAIINCATKHIKSRFSDIDLLSAHYSLERITDDSSDSRNWFIQVMFLYDKRGYYQVVPVLIDGRIILSNIE